MDGYINFRQVLRAISSPIAVYAAALAVCAAALAASLVVAGHGFGSLWALIPIALIGAIAERERVRFSSRTELSISLLPTLFTAVVFGPLPAMAVAAVGMLGDFRRPRMRWFIYTLSEAITAGVTGLVAMELSDAISGEMASVAVGTFGAAVVAQTLDVFFACVTMRLRRAGSLSETVALLGPAVVASIPLYTPLVALLAFTYNEVSPWALPFFVVPAVAAQRLFILYQAQRRLADDLASAIQQLEKANLSFAAGLVATLDARDRYTAGHSAAVAVYARDIAARMGLDETQQSLAHLAGLVHDIGKIGLPPGLLEKTGPLTLDERRQMEQHCVIGETILSKVDDYAEIASIVRHHHERVDGLGYPDGLRGPAIPLISRIISVADAYDAMTSDRPYRDAMPSRVARLRLAQAVESQFDTAVVAAFEAILAGAPETYRLGSHSNLEREAGDLTVQQTAGAAYVA
ncbi:MAG: HD-GYP domain-containing protein [Actinomycetota bacterium]|nr:HD-GYP domain-containing protein [Actinomycetota bacterium]